MHSNASTTAVHPLQPLSGEEIETAVGMLKTAGHIKDKTRVVSVSLIEPVKQFVFGWQPGQPFARKVEATLLDREKNACYTVKVDFKDGSVEKTKHERMQPLITVDEMAECENAVVTNEQFRNKIMEHYGDEPACRFDNIICDIWSAGYYGEEKDEGLRLARPLCFFKDTKSENPYAYPIEGLRPVVDLNKMEVLRVEDYGKWPLPPEHDARHRAANMEDLRKDLKPLEIVQPEGASFTVNDNIVKWQKWSVIVGFNAKEGLTLHDVRYEGRPILYRAAISDMVVPYGDPAVQQSRKNAFDVSDYGIGYCTNSLKLGCDCLGEIKYFNGELVNSKGDLWTIEHAVCMHEEDYGILWKHYDRHSNSSEIRRSRRLVISSFATVENYDYGFYWYFYQDGNIQLEVKLTGFLSVGTVHKGEDRKYGNLVAPQLWAPNHQHFFNFRLDFAVNGIENSVFEVDAVSEEKGDEHPFKNGFYGKATRFETESQAKSHVNPAVSRTWNITNENRFNWVGMPVAYKLIPMETIRPFASEDAYWRQRARFVDYHIWVTPFNKEEFCCAGKFPNQNKEDQGLPVWTSQNRKVGNEDLVVWYTFGVTHVPRPEDYPVMPTVYTGFLLKPFGFFDRNPAWDVPPQCHVNKNPASREA